MEPDIVILKREVFRAASNYISESIVWHQDIGRAAGYAKKADFV